MYKTKIKTPCTLKILDVKTCAKYLKTTHLFEPVLLRLGIVGSRNGNPHRLPEHELPRLHLGPDSLRQRPLFRRLFLQQLVLLAQRPALHLFHLLVVPNDHLVALQEEDVLQLALHQLVLLVDLFFFDLPQGGFSRSCQLLFLLGWARNSSKNSSNSNE